MPKKDLTEIIAIIDRSGSMGLIRNDVIGGYNTFLEDQQKLAGEAVLTFAQFDDVYEIIHDGAPIADVKPLDEDTYVPRGSTALLDAVGKTVTTAWERIQKIHGDDRPEKVIAVIFTDGQENSSKEWKLDQIKALVEARRKDGWEFLFLGADEKAFGEAQAMGMNMNLAASYVPNSAGVRGAYRNVSNLVSESRTGGVIGKAPGSSSGGSSGGLNH